MEQQQSQEKARREPERRERTEETRQAPERARLAGAGYTLRMRPDVEVRGNEETLRAVFVKKDCYFADYF